MNSDNTPEPRPLSAEGANSLLVNISKIIKIINQKGGDFNKRLDDILQILLDYMGVEQGSIMVLEGRKLVVATASRREIIGKKQALDDESIAALAAKTAAPVFIPDISADPRFNNRRQHNQHYKKNALLSLPIFQDDQLLGVINITDKLGDKDLLQEDITYLLDFSSMIISTLVQQRLHQQLRRQKDTLRQKNKELKRQESLRDELYKMLIHDLKAPLAEVVANLDIMSYSISEENREFLAAAQMSCDRAVRMANNLVAINKLEDGKLVPCPEEVHPKALLEEALSALRGLAQIKNVELILTAAEELPVVYVDRILILRVLQNLLTNALGYTTPGTRITAGCNYLRADGEVEFFVQDEGPGLAEDRQDKIFEKYSRLSDKQDALVGTGLGLYFCRLAVEVHKGKIALTSKPGEGCRFYFLLRL
ncbi:Two-component system sensor histidine kinase [hydrothermal vent metagenome]|uniref:histidine kinase n=1 Tax=hydrothermal vent metagenome TaxID=652676 RepID=A0A3B0VSU9_9ZZZZ